MGMWKPSSIFKKWIPVSAWWWRKIEVTNYDWLKEVILLALIHNYYIIYMNVWLGHFRRTFDIYETPNFRLCRSMTLWNSVHIMFEFVNLEHIMHVPNWMRSISCDVWRRHIWIFSAPLAALKYTTLFKMSYLIWWNWNLLPEQMWLSSKGHIAKTFILLV